MRNILLPTLITNYVTESKIDIRKDDKTNKSSDNLLGSVKLMNKTQKINNENNSNDNDNDINSGKIDKKNKNKSSSNLVNKQV